MKFTAYFILFIVFASLLFISSEHGLLEIISLDTIVLSLVIILCSNWIVKTIRTVHKD